MIPSDSSRAGRPTTAEARGAVEDGATLMAAAYLSRVAEPTNPALFEAVRAFGLVQTADRVRSRDVPPALLTATEARHQSADPDADLEAADRCGIVLITPTNPAWPHFALACLYAHTARSAPDRPAMASLTEAALLPPIALWVKGRTDLLASAGPSAALVGSRAATEYGSRITADLAYGLAREGVTVVSGGAYGVDAAAHRGALAAAGATVLFSAAGLDRAYPTGNRGLYDRIATEGLLVSEYPPGCAPQRHRFLARNRLIASFAQTTVVVEAAVRSGALNTARHARRLGKPVLAVPGPVTSAMSAGAHDLIRRDGDPARLVTSVADVMPYCGSLTMMDDARADRGDQTDLTDALDLITRRVLDGLPSDRSVGPVELARLSGCGADDVRTALPTLCALGLVDEGASGYRRTALARRRPRRG